MSSTGGNVFINSYLFLSSNLKVALGPSDIFFVFSAYPLSSIIASAYTII